MRELEQVIQIPDLADVERRLGDAILGSLGERAPAFAFTNTRTTDCCELEFALGPDGPFPTGLESQLESAGHWHARLKVPGKNQHFDTSLEFRAATAYWVRRPSSDDLVELTAKFFGDPRESMDETQLAQANVRHADLLSRLFSQLEIELSEETIHVGNTRFVVAKSPRHEFGCSLPDGTVFQVLVKVPEPPSAKQQREFRCRLLSTAEIVAARLDASLRSQLVTIVEPDPTRPVSATHVSRLEAAGAGEAQVVSPVHLFRFGSITRRCLETRPVDLRLEE
ncbi:MAG: hypothetical protein HZB39_05595 [Planctomycetes bacterium]|nr:hypothetical protein [Planctomycetota bacterium]